MSNESHTSRWRQQRKARLKQTLKVTSRSDHIHEARTFHWNMSAPSPSCHIREAVYVKSRAFQLQIEKESKLVEKTIEDNILEESVYIMYKIVEIKPHYLHFCACRRCLHLASLISDSCFLSSRTLEQVTPESNLAVVLRRLSIFRKPLFFLSMVPQYSTDSEVC